MEMHKLINEKLAEIAAAKKIRILLACETGSRGWGFPSPDSDYDVRFIYLHEPDWYISVNEKEDHITVPINDELDITGWDLRKSLQLLIKHNAALMERLQSPIIYNEVPGFKEAYFDLAQKNFSAVSVMHHYLSMAKNYYEKCTSSEVKLKNLFYGVRTAITCDWIKTYRTLPPMELYKLIKVIEKDKRLVGRIRELVELKSGKNESYMHTREDEINQYLEKTITNSDEVIKSLPSNKYSVDELNAFLLKNINDSKRIEK